MHYYYRKFLLFSKYILPAVVLLLIHKIQLDTKIFYSICELIAEAWIPFVNQIVCQIQQTCCLVISLAPCCNIE